jgi:hypothetical protein
MKRLWKDVCDLHHVTESAIISDTDEMDAFDPSADIETSGSGLSAMATIGRFSLCYVDIVANAAEYGLDARDEMNELDGCEAESSGRCRRHRFDNSARSLFNGVRCGKERIKTASNAPAVAKCHIFATDAGLIDTDEAEALRNTACGVLTQSVRRPHLLQVHVAQQYSNGERSGVGGRDQQCL